MTFFLVISSFCHFSCCNLVISSLPRHRDNDGYLEQQDFRSTNLIHNQKLSKQTLENFQSCLISYLVLLLIVVVGGGVLVITKILKIET